MTRLGAAPARTRDVAAALRAAHHRTRCWQATCSGGSPKARWSARVERACPPFLAMLLTGSPGLVTLRTLAWWPGSVTGCLQRSGLTARANRPVQECRLRVMGGKTLSEYMFSEYPQIADIVGAS